MGAVTPLFVFGMGRSGTTNALRALNAHPEVMLTGEVPLSVMKQLFALVDAADRSHAGDGEVSRGWRARKADFLFESLGYLAKGGRGQLRKIAGARFRGHKLPRGETLFDRYEAHFSAAGEPPRYVYCARNPFDCWRSYRQMSWSGHDTVESFIAQYVESFAQLAHMRRRAEGRVVVLGLDGLIAAADELAWYRARLFEPLGLSLPDRVAARIEGFAQDRAGGPAQALPPDEAEAIERHPAMQALIAEMFAPGASAAPR